VFGGDAASNEEPSASGSENKHQMNFSASGACSLKVIGDNTQESTAEGPWQEE